MRRRNRQAGQALFLTAAALIVLIGILGLGVDIGMLRHEKRIQQTAADAAAIAGANNLAFEGIGSVTPAAQNASAANGFTDSGLTCPSTGGMPSASTPGQVCVQVNSPPLSGPHTCANDTNCNDYVEAFVSAVHHTYFMPIFDLFGGNHDSAVIIARAVATDYSGASPNNNCLYTLGNPTNEIGVNVQGSATLNAETCGIVDNGNFDPNGNKIQVNTCSFNVSGTGCSGPGCNNVSCAGSTMTPAYSSPTAQDPLSSMNSKTPCDKGYACSGGPTVSNPTGNYMPPASACIGQTAGYAGVCTLSSITVKGSVNFMPGIYIIDGSDGNIGFNCNAGAQITGTGVMFFFTQTATINCYGNVTIGNPSATPPQGLTAPNATNCPLCPSDYAGMLMWQDPPPPTGNPGDTSTGNLSASGGSCTSNSTPGPRLGGNTGSWYNGILYFPGDQLWFYGNNSTTSNTTVDAMISDSLCMSGSPILNLQGTSGMGTPFPTLTNAILVE